MPGASALLAALAASGLPTDRFVFWGFLPRQAGERRRVIAELAADRRTSIFYEAPHRLRRTLEDLAPALGDRLVCLAREITKLHEEFYRGTVADALAHFAEPRGEFTVVVAGAPDLTLPPDAATVEERIAELLFKGSPPAAAARTIAAEFGLSRRDVYDRIRRRADSAGAGPSGGSADDASGASERRPDSRSAWPDRPRPGSPGSK